MERKKTFEPRVDRQKLFFFLALGALNKLERSSLRNFFQASLILEGNVEEIISSLVR